MSPRPRAMSLRSASFLLFKSEIFITRDLSFSHATIVAFLSGLNVSASLSSVSRYPLVSRYPSLAANSHPLHQPVRLDIWRPKLVLIPGNLERRNAIKEVGRNVVVLTGPHPQY